ncbi:MAG: TrkA family potassium uptake protein [Deltaproteobacteria bacterium]|nr:MAG: TrkA family potassium uptake protein [Deltaproteobacteria bacterium]
MARQALVIGLGQFGMALARELAAHGTEVLAVDVKEGRIDAIAPYVADAVVMDAMEEDALANLSPADRDACICAIGDDNREGSIIVTALLRQLGARRVIARATDAVHARILKLIGAHEVVNPEQAYGERLAIRIAWRNVVDVLPLGGDLVLTEMEAPEAFWGRTLAELELPKRFGVIVSALRVGGDTGMVTTIPDPNRPLAQGDILMLVSTEKDARRLSERA